MSTASGDGRSRAIFISYRRDDSEGESGRLYDDLVRTYGDASVFMDVSGIQPGLDFRKAIDDNVASCGVLLAVIGPTWATITGHDGTRRLDNPDDYVRLEIASALKRGIPVIPVLVHEAHMPALEQLPDDLKDLRYRNSVELTHARWSSDVALFITALKSYVDTRAANPEAPVHATVPVQLPARQETPSAPVAKSRAPLFVGIGIAAVAVFAGIIFFVLHNKSAVDTQPAVATTSASQPTVSPAPAPASQPTPSGSPKPHNLASDAAFQGKWKITREPTGADNLTRLEIVDYEGKPMVEAWGKCPDHSCSWGSKRASVRGTELVTDSWDLRNTAQEQKLQRSVTLSIVVTADGLQVTAKNRYHQPNGETTDFYNQVDFVKVP